MPSTGFEPAIPAVKRLQTCALDRTATGVGRSFEYQCNYILFAVPNEHVLLVQCRCQLIDITSTQTFSTQRTVSQSVSQSIK